MNKMQSERGRTYYGVLLITVPRTTWAEAVVAAAMTTAASRQMVKCLMVERCGVAAGWAGREDSCKETVRFKTWAKEKNTEGIYTST